MYQLIIRQAIIFDNKYDIAECIYDTDPYIYPTAFGHNRENAIKLIIKLLNMKDSIFDYKNIIIAKLYDKICGIFIISKGDNIWNLNTVKSRLGFLTDGMVYTSKKYFSHFNIVENGDVEIVACCINKKFRRQHIASKLFDYIINKYKDKELILTVLQNNIAAINLYKSKGFEIIEKDVLGFSYINIPRPLTCIMKYSN